MSNSPKTQILVVEDEEAIATLIIYNLEKEGFEVEHVPDGEDALEAIRANIPDIVLLDWMLPSISGIDVCKKLRADSATRSIPIIMLTARGEETDRVYGLDIGADDYITKPFSPSELVARIRAVIRRIRPSLADGTLDYEGITMDMASHNVFFGETEIKLGPTEFRLLAHFMESPGRIFSREQLLDNVWGKEIYVESRTVDVHIRRLRKALEDASPTLKDVIKTVRSAGYKLEKR
jgi:two-component system phosphate regulon response regulator PhoB